MLHCSHVWRTSNWGKVGRGGKERRGGGYVGPELRSQHVCMLEAVSGGWVVLGWVVLCGYGLVVADDVVVAERCLGAAVGW